jgi:hypothetical protein
MKAHVVLSPVASKRLIAKGVKAHPIVQDALQAGTVVVTLGTTNAFVAAELSGATIDHGAFAAGVIDDRWNLNARIDEARELVLKDGRRQDVEPEKLLSSLGAGDVIIKGGNALDPFGIVGVLMAAATGGSAGRYVPLAQARGVDIVIPISVAKSVHASIPDLALAMGAERLDLGDGLACGMYPLVGHVVSEIEAIELLFSVEATHVASGGVGAGVGSVSLLLEGDEGDVRGAYDLIQSLKAGAEPIVQGTP